MNSLELAKDNISRLHRIAELALEKEIDQHFREVLLENDKKEAKRQEQLKKELGEFYALLDTREGGEIRDTKEIRDTRSAKRCRDDTNYTKNKCRKLNPLPKKEDSTLLNLIEYQKNKISSTLLKQKEELAKLRAKRNFNLRVENELICDIDTNRAMIIALSSFKYKSYINDKKYFRILEAETNIKYSIVRIKNIESRSKIYIRNIIYNCLDEYNIFRKCKLCNGINNYPQLQQNYIPIICNNNEKLCIICTKCVSDMAKKKYKGSIGTAVKVIKKNNIY